MPRSTTYVPITAHSTPTITLASSALTMKAYCRGSSNQFIYDLNMDPTPRRLSRAGQLLDPVFEVCSSILGPLF